MTNIFPIDFEEKLTMAQDDYILFSDSEDGNKIKKAQYKNLKWEKGDPWTPWADWQDWAAATITVWSVTTWAAGSSATVVNSWTSSAAILDFSIPQGIAWADGQDWADGAAATITVGTTTTLPAWSSATVTNSWTSSAAVLNFWIPKGDAWVQDAKVFTLSSTSDLTNAQAAYDWYASWKEAIILYSWRYYYFKSTWGGSVYFAVNEYTTLDNTDVTSLVQKTLTLALSWTTVTSVSSWNMSLTNYNVLRTGKDYWTPYTPQYNGSPATKKYVDDSISWAIYSWSSAPATPTEWMLWYDTTNDVLKTYDGSNWNAVWSGSWDVVWPASSTDWHLAVFDWATGKLIKDWGAIPTWVPSVWTNGQVLTVVSWVAAWANASGWDVLVSSQTGNILTTGMKIRAWTESDYSGLWTYDSNTLYLTIPDQS